jgi:hypothetical protein
MWTPSVIEMEAHWTGSVINKMNCLLSWRIYENETYFVETHNASTEERNMLSFCFLSCLV